MRLLTLRDVLRGRLALRIYLVGLIQFAVVAAGMVILFEAGKNRHRNPHAAEVRFVFHSVEQALENPKTLDKMLASALTEVEATITVKDADGKVVVTNAQNGPPTCVPTSVAAHSLSDRSPCYVKEIRLPDGRQGRIEQINPLPLPPRREGSYIIALVLVVVGVSSWLLARTLTNPLRKLSTAAQAFGAGDLKARAALAHRDELGDVSHAFDEMAERVTNLLRAERELLANVSHELRTPLSRIRMALALVSESEGDAAMAREMFGEIGADMDELERLIDDVLTAARLEFDEAGSPTSIPPLRRQSVDVRELLKQAASRFSAAHSKRTLNVDMPETLPSVFADPVLLRRVFDNLLENAQKYTEDPGAPISLLVRAEADITVDVIDQGIGIAADDLAKVFRPFYRADKSRTRTTGGLGLGLPLAKRIVDAHGGKIELTSAVGKGTTVRVHLPIAR